MCTIGTLSPLQLEDILLIIEFFHNSRVILDEFNKIKFSKKLTSVGIEPSRLHNSQAC